MPDIKRPKIRCENYVRFPVSLSINCENVHRGLGQTESHFAFCSVCKLAAGLFDHFLRAFYVLQINFKYFLLYHPVILLFLLAACVTGRWALQGTEGRSHDPQKLRLQCLQMSLALVFIRYRSKSVRSVTPVDSLHYSNVIQCPVSETHFILNKTLKGEEGTEKIFR